jgi:hypothetical protein
MLVLSAVIEVARSDAPEQWARYCGLVAILVFDDVAAADAPREFLRVRLSGYDATQGTYSDRPEHAACLGLTEIFQARFVEALRVGRYRVYGTPQGGTEVEVDPELVAAAEFWHLRGNTWRLDGTTYVGVHVEPGELTDASPEEAHTEIAAEYEHCRKTGRKPPNVMEIRAPVQDRLRKKGLYMAGEKIGDLAGDKRYEGLRLKQGHRPKRT